MYLTERVSVSRAKSQFFFRGVSIAWNRNLSMSRSMTRKMDDILWTTNRYQLCDFHFCEIATFSKNTSICTHRHCKIRKIERDKRIWSFFRFVSMRKKQSERTSSFSLYLGVFLGGGFWIFFRGKTFPCETAFTWKCVDTEPKSSNWNWNSDRNIDLIYQPLHNGFSTAWRSLGPC